MAAAAMTVASLLTASVAAQKPTARELYQEEETNSGKGKSGVKVSVLLKRGSENERYVAPTETFYSGDKIKLAFDVNFSGYVALLNVGSSGRVTLLYPYVGASSKVEPRTQQQLIPSDSRDWIAFDNHPGTEQITIVFSINPLQSVKEIIDFSEQSGKANAAGSGENGQLYAANDKKSQEILQKLNTSSLERAKRSVLASETTKSAAYAVVDPGAVKDPVAFVVNLKHENR